MPNNLLHTELLKRLAQWTKRQRFELQEAMRGVGAPKTPTGLAISP